MASLIKRTIQVTKDNFGQLFLFALIAGIVNYVLMFIPVVGQIIGSFIIFLMYIEIYKQLKARKPFRIADCNMFPNLNLQLFWLHIVIIFKTFLWSLLFIIPGIVKGIGYQRALLLKVLHPEMTNRDAILESERQMMGSKMRYFLFPFITGFLSFLLVSLLSELLGVVGFILGFLAIVVVALPVNMGFFAIFNIDLEESGYIEE